MTELRRSTVHELASTVAAPDYDLGRLRSGIVHFGVGAFHRSHEAMFVDRLLAAGHTDWALHGVGVLPADAATRDALASQDQLYTLVTVEPDGHRSARIIGSIANYTFAPDDPHGLVELLASPATRIVSLTITEGGYGVSDSTGVFEPQDDATLRDLHDLTSPSSVFGFLTAALALRRARGIAAFTVMSCDNIEHNGSVARIALTSFARHHSDELADWIGTEVAFPSSMVDRITPATDAAVIQDVSVEFGIEDQTPVRSESFAQWVLEDTFSDGRPPFDTVGVHLVDDVVPYEHMKLRLLNASHQVMSYLGVLAGHTYVHDVLADPDLAAFIASYMRDEAAPTLGPVPDVDVSVYIDQLLQRFSSPAVRDTLARQIVDASVRIPKFVLPVVRHRLQHGQSVAHAALTLAAWSEVYHRGDVAMVDPDADRLRSLSWADHDSPGAFLDNVAVFGDLAGSPRLRGAYQLAKRSLQDFGPVGAVKRFVQVSGHA